MNIDETKAKNKDYSKGQIRFTNYCLEKIKQRDLTKEIIHKCLLGNNLLKSEVQKVLYKGEIEERHKLTYKLSTKYYLIIIVGYKEKVLNIINIIKTSKDLEKKWRKKISR